MKQPSSKADRSTMISWDEDYPQLHIDTASETMYRKLLKLGYNLILDKEHHAVFTAPVSSIVFKKVGTPLESSPDPLKQGVLNDPRDERSLG